MPQTLTLQFQVGRMYCIVCAVTLKQQHSKYSPVRMTQDVCLPCHPSLILFHQTLEEELYLRPWHLEGRYHPSAIKRWRHQVLKSKSQYAANVKSVVTNFKEISFYIFQTDFLKRTTIRERCEEIRNLPNNFSVHGVCSIPEHTCHTAAIKIYQRRKFAQ